MTEKNDHDTPLLDKDNNVQKMEIKKYEKEIKCKCIPARAEVLKRCQRVSDSWRHASMDDNNIFEKVAAQLSNDGQKSSSGEVKELVFEHKRKLDPSDLARQTSDQIDTSERSILSTSFPLFAEPSDVKQGSPESIKGNNARVLSIHLPEVQDLLFTKHAMNLIETPCFFVKISVL